MNLDELLTTLESPIVICPTRRMTQGELESYLDKAADSLRGNADHSEFRGYVFALLFYKRISDCFDEEVRTQAFDLPALAEPAGLRYADLAIKNQRTRWGSCSATGRISLNRKLLFLPRDLVRYVIWHELCHLLEPNHSQRFWMHLRHFEPAADSLHGRMRDAWKVVPTWAQRGAGLVL